MTPPVPSTPEEIEDWYWGPGGLLQTTSKPETQVVVDGEHYLMADENAPGGMRGYGGRRFTVAFRDGRTVTTTNLWHQGPVPDRFRDLYPDNAQFVQPNPTEGTTS